MGILRGADCGDEFGEVAAVEPGTGVEMPYAGEIPCSRYEGAGPECRLSVLSVRDVRQDDGDDLGGEQHFAAGSRGRNHWGLSSWCLSLSFFLETYWDLEGLGHLYIPVALSIESHGDEF